MMTEIVHSINVIILWYFIILSIGYIILLAGSITDIIFKFKESDLGNINVLLKSLTMPPVTIIIPAYNEEEYILEPIFSILKNNYTNTAILVVNDGSTDQTMAKLIDYFELYQVTPIIRKIIPSNSKIKGFYISKKYKNITVIDKEHRDKSDCLNIGLNACRTPLFITIDADTLLVEPDAISNIVFTMLTNPHTVAVGGAVYILNGCIYKEGEIIEAKMSYRPLYALQICEYLRSFLFGRSGWNTFGGALCFPGAFTLLERKAVLDLGGFEVGNTAQDFEIITHLHAYGFEHKYPYKFSFTPAAAVWTDVPGSLKEFWHQRSAWQRGSLHSLMRYKRMLFSFKYGIAGWFTYPFYLFGEILGAMFEFVAYLSILFSWYFGILDMYWTILFFIICWGFITFLTMVTVLINYITFNKYKRIRDLLWILVLVVIEQFGFRQYHVTCRVIATIRYFFRSLKFWNWGIKKND